MQKWMVKFLRKLENHRRNNLRIIKMLELTRFDLVTKSINLQLFTLILYGVGVRCDRRQFLVHSPFIEKSMPVTFIYSF